MLLELSIKNFAIIDDLSITFQEGLTILSGETGAGKSVIINAMTLLLGGRAHSDLIRSGGETAEIEALFDIPEDVSQKLEAAGHEPSDELVARRVIARNGRSRIHVNGRLATIGLLKSIAGGLAGISAQRSHQGLLKEESHLFLLDQFAGLSSMREELTRLHKEALPLIEKLDEIRSREERRAERIELLRFQEDEILKTRIQPDEDRDLEEERLRIKNHATLYETAYNSIEELYSRQGSVVEKMAAAARSLEKAADIDPALKPHARAVEDASLQVEDIAQELRGYLADISIDENRLEEIEARVDTLNRLKRKYGGSLEGISAHLDSVRKERAGIEGLAETRAEIEAAIQSSHEKRKALCLDLSEKRKKAAKTLSKKAEAELASLKMPRTRFSVSLDPAPAPEGHNPYLMVGKFMIGETGMDRASFVIAPNPGEPGKPLAAIASGGELSRVVLALKAILSENESLETVVFDEVDAGIGGEVAEVVGKKLLSLSTRHQVICITHLPQIARFADAHFRISKHVEDGRTLARIRPLDSGERLREVARMLGGEKITEATLEHAREMLNIRNT
ncbi:DNA repair protein RecN [Candidatus Desulfarcum epimagneticum]|uniref:DNA repair protein RecN n=1 Tax=uncultured Desulfobacteraceae bacterium TaxID=218296 RepID=A0A484HPY9_9BACT|nr:DNA repair protein RecN [uncultured Desulfobacteraceae bacterium]